MTLKRGRGAYFIMYQEKNHCFLTEKREKLHLTDGYPLDPKYVEVLQAASKRGSKKYQAPGTKGHLDPETASDSSPYSHKF